MPYVVLASNAPSGGLKGLNAFLCQTFRYKFKNDCCPRRTTHAFVWHDIDDNTSPIDPHLQTCRKDHLSEENCITTVAPLLTPRFLPTSTTKSDTPCASCYHDKLKINNLYRYHYQPHNQTHSPNPYQRRSKLTTHTQSNYSSTTILPARHLPSLPCSNLVQLPEQRQRTEVIRLPIKHTCNSRCYRRSLNTLPLQPHTLTACWHPQHLNRIPQP